MDIKGQTRKSVLLLRNTTVAPLNYNSKTYTRFNLLDIWKILRASTVFQRHMRLLYLPFIKIIMADSVAS